MHERTRSATHQKIVILLSCIRETLLEASDRLLQNLPLLPRLQWQFPASGHSCGYRQLRWMSGVPRVFATTVTPSTPPDIVASACMRVGWILLKKRRLIRWATTLIPESCQATCSFLKLEDELLVEEGSDVMWGRHYSRHHKVQGPAELSLGDKSPISVFLVFKSSYFG